MGGTASASLVEIKIKLILFCISLTYSYLCDKSREDTASRHKKETFFFCSALDFSYLCTQICKESTFILMDYNFRDIEKKWQKRWVENCTYRVTEDKDKQKFYVLNMFPYPSGAGLHVGHPLGYIASDIYARYKRLKGFNVLNPMGYDAYGLPAEQYAIQTGQHPAITTEQNINRYR